MLKNTKIVAVGVASALCLAIAAPGDNYDTARTAAASGEDFDLSWHTVDGGGGTSIGGDFVLRGTIGQPDAGDLTGGDFTLRGGFWQTLSSGCGTCPTDGPVSGPDGDVGAADLGWVLGNWGAFVDNVACQDEKGNFVGCPADLVCLDELEPQASNQDIGPEEIAKITGSWGPCPR